MSISVEICLLPSKIASFAANWHGVKTPEQRTGRAIPDDSWRRLLNCLIHRVQGIEGRNSERVEFRQHRCVLPAGPQGIEFVEQVHPARLFNGVKNHS